MEQLFVVWCHHFLPPSFFFFSFSCFVCCCCWFLFLAMRRNSVITEFLSEHFASRCLNEARKLTNSVQYLTCDTELTKRALLFGLYSEIPTPSLCQMPGPAKTTTSALENHRVVFSSLAGHSQPSFEIVLGILKLF